MDVTKPAAVVLCLTATGLSVVRSLAQHGIAVHGVDANPMQIGLYSKGLASRAVISCVEQKERLLAYLLKLSANAQSNPVLIAAGDEEVGFICSHEKTLRAAFVLPDSCTPEFGGLLLNKIHFYRTCLALGADIPRTFFPQSLKDVKAAAETLRYPAIVKPGFGHAWRERFKGKKVLEFDSPEELISAFGDYGLDPQEMVIQEVVPGKEENIAVFGGYFNKHAEPLAVFTAKKTRQYPPMFGSGSLLESRWYPEIAEKSIALLKKMGFHGICGTEYKWDPRDGTWKLMEINFRPTLWYAITRAAGVDVVHDAYLDMTGRPVKPKIGTQKNGVLWQYLVRDAAAVLWYLRRGLVNGEKLRQFLKPNKECAVLSMNDWRVNMMYPLYAVSEYFRHR